MNLFGLNFISFTSPDRLSLQLFKYC